VILPGGGFALAVFSSLMRALDYAQVHFADQRIEFHGLTTQEMLDLLGDLKRTATSQVVLDRCPRCSIFTTGLATGLDTTERIVAWWAIAKSLELARFELYWKHASAMVAAGNFERAREIALEIVGHVTPDRPQPHVLLGHIAIELNDEVLLREATEYLMFLKHEDWAEALARQAGRESASLETRRHKEISESSPPSEAGSEETTHSSPERVTPERSPRQAERAAAQSVGDLLAGVFRVKDVKRGGMGVVYIVEFEADKATDSQHRDFWAALSGAPANDTPGRLLGRSWFAIKMLRDEAFLSERAILRFERECLVWCTLLPHPNVVRAYTADRIDGRTPFVLLEFVAGGNLRDRMQQAMDPYVAMRLALQVCRGMEFLRTTAGIVHRDIKPENILVAADETAKITDLGLVEVLGAGVASPATADRTDEVVDVNFTAANHIAGSIPYMSPEHFLGTHVDTRSDIYSFGVVLHEMIGGRRPFQATDLLSYGRCHLEEDPPALSNVASAPTPISDAVLKCLAKHPDDRFQNFGELGEHLMQLCRDAGMDSAAPDALSDDELRARITAADWEGRGRALLMIGEALSERNVPDESQPYLERACSAFARAHDCGGQSASMHLVMGRTLHLLKKFEEAAAHFRDCIARDPDMADGYLALSDSLTAAGRSEEGASVLRAAAARFPRNGPVQLRTTLLNYRQRSAEWSKTSNQASTPPQSAAIYPTAQKPHRRWLQRLMDLVRPVSGPMSPGLAGWNEVDTQRGMRVWRDAVGDVLTLSEMKEALNGPEPVDEWARQSTARSVAEERNGGVIEAWPVSNVHGSGWGFIYKKLDPPAYIFTGMLFLPDAHCCHLWSIVAGERGPRTGVREATIKSELLAEATANVADLERRWAQDPYDPDYHRVERAVLCCLSDDARYDERFPDHPLTKVRRIMAALPTAAGRH
jgi:serine/threonine protein kinase